jgi:hypothetical protein
MGIKTMVITINDVAGLNVQTINPTSILQDTMPR